MQLKEKEQSLVSDQIVSITGATSLSFSLSSLSPIFATFVQCEKFFTTSLKQELIGPKFSSLWMKRQNGNPHFLNFYFFKNISALLPLYLILYYCPSLCYRSQGSFSNYNINLFGFCLLLCGRVNASQSGSSRVWFPPGVRLLFL